MAFIYKRKFREMATIAKFFENGNFRIIVKGDEGPIPHFHVENITNAKYTIKIKIPNTLPNSYKELDIMNWEKIKNKVPSDFNSILKDTFDILKSKPKKLFFENKLEEIKYQWDVNNIEYSKFGYGD